MLHKSIARFSICKCICAEVAAIWICAWALTRQYAHPLDIWSKYDSFAYLMTYFECVNKFAHFLANLKYASKLKHMSRGYIPHVRRDCK